MRNVIICIMVVLLCSCNDILKEKPQSIAVETFYNTPGEIEAGIAAIYVPLRSTSTTYLSMLTVSSDMFLSGRGSWAPPSQYQGLNNTNMSRVQSNWTDFYLAIRNANLIIESVPNSTATTDDEKKQYVGEAKFLRAFSYFHLVRCWGSIPLRDETNMGEINVPRSPVNEIYNLIISDLEAAEQYLPDQISVAGHPSKWSAKTLLADVYFQTNQYDKAAEKSNEVIKSNAFSLVDVSSTDDFENIFGPTATSSTEEVFYLKFNEERSWVFPQCLHGVGTKYLTVDGYFVVYSNVDYTVYQNWDNNDLRKVYDWYEYKGFDPGTILCKKYSDPDALAARNDYPAYRYADCLLIYAESSCRAKGAPTAEGLEALNKVHRRAYGYPSAQSSPVDFKLRDYDADSFNKLCIQERGYETVAEGKRWFDLKRLGKTEATKYIKENRGSDVSESHWLWPIPVSELNYNEAITDQNPGY